jgi:hypothetical protein
MTYPVQQWAINKQKVVVEFQESDLKKYAVRLILQYSGVRSLIGPRLVRSAYDRGSLATLVGHLRASLSRWVRLYLQSLAPANPYRARVVGYDRSRCG